MMRYWIAVASAEHVLRGRTEGFMQVCHGKRAPLARMEVGDGVVTYSPTTRFGEKDGLQSFTALGRLREGVPYSAARSDGREAFRRDVDWDGASDPAPIRPLLGRLAFVGEGPNWGYRFRFGLFSISPDDFEVIAEAMRHGQPAPMPA